MLEEIEMTQMQQNEILQVLVVEDEPTICEVCRRALTGEGFEVDIAVNGKVAQVILAEKDYNLILIDIRTPLMNGKELYQWISEQRPDMENGVVFTTGDVTGEDTRSFLKQAGRSFLPKPFTPDELKTVVREALKQIRK